MPHIIRQAGSKNGHAALEAFERQAMAEARVAACDEHRAAAQVGQQLELSIPSPLEGGDFRRFASPSPLTA